MQRTTLAIAASSLLAVTSICLAWSSATRAHKAENELASVRTELASEIREIHRLLNAREQESGTGRDLTTAAHQSESRRTVASHELGGDGERQDAAGLTESGLSLYERFATLDSEGREDALEALTDLARLGDEKALELILASLHDEDAEVREEAVESIQDLSDPSLAGYLEALVNDEVPDVREEVAEALRGMEPERAGPILEGMLADSDPDIIAEALDSLRSLDYNAAIPRIADLTRGDDLDMVARAASTLRRMDRPDLMLPALDRVAAGLNSHDALDRINAIGRVRRVGGAAAIEYLERVVAQDTNVSVRLEAQRALSRLKG